MLSVAMIEKLNEQINMEFFSSNLYLQKGGESIMNGQRQPQA